MHPERLILGFLMRGEVGEERLFESIARALGVPHEEVARFDVDGPADAAVLVERALRPAGFRTDVSLYADVTRASGARGLTSVEVATRVSALLGEEAIVSPPADDPAVAVTWFLVTPDGKRFRASEASLDEDSVDIDRSTLRPE